MKSNINIDSIRQAPHNYMVLERIPLTASKLELPHRLSEPVGDELEIVVLDVETTGLDADACEMIELGCIKVTYSPSENKFVDIIGVIDELEEPNTSISSEIESITGITNEMVKGKKFNESKVAAFFSQDPIVIAHNAAFDRKFFQSRFPSLSSLRWSCSIKEIDWYSKGLGSAKLEYILFKLGYFYDAHRAYVDCLATLWAIHQTQSLIDILKFNHSKLYTVKAWSSPFSVKDALKQRGYKWSDGSDGFDKHWWTSINEDNVEEEYHFLQALYFNGGDNAEMIELSSRERYC